MMSIVEIMSIVMLILTQHMLEYIETLIYKRR